MLDPVRRPQVPQRCHSCGSLVTFDAKAFREDTALNWRCPGCGSAGTSFYKDLPLGEAKALAREQNDLASTSEAAAEATSWEERRARWVASDAALFLDLVRSRFPQWLEHFHYELDPYLRGSFRITIPSANAQADTPLILLVGINEVLISWVTGWHEHVWREQDAGQSDKSHLHRALDDVEDLVQERIVTGTCYVDGRLSSGGNIKPGEGIPEDWKERSIAWDPGKPIRVIARSWHGTYDEEWHSDSSKQSDDEGPEACYAR